MPDRPLADCRILIVEDDYLIADELRTELGDAGAVVLGPVATLRAALELIAQEQAIDGAVLDVNLRGEKAFAAADALAARGVPFILATGYDEATIPHKFAGVDRCGKPVDIARVVCVLGRKGGAARKGR